MRRLLQSATSNTLGPDIITDGEIRRESYSNKFANALAGVDPHKEGVLKLINAGQTRSIPVPLFSGLARDASG